MGVEYHILEQFTQSKTGNPEDNEDGIVLTEGFIAVYDITSSYSYGLNAFTDRIAGLKGLLHDSIAALPANATPRKTFASLSQRMQEFATRHREVLCPEVSLTIVSLARREAWQVGDVIIWESNAVHGSPPFHPVKILETHMSHIRAAYVKHLIHRRVITPEEIRNNDPGRDYVVPFLRVASTFRNILSPYGYGTVTDSPVPSQYLHVHKLTQPVGKSEIILRTDGYPYTYGTLAESETALREAILADPLCLDELIGLNAVQKNHVSYGDRTYVKAVL